MLLKTFNFKKDILEAALEHVAADKADTTIGTISFGEMLKKRILKKAAMDSYDFDAAILV